MTWQVIAFLVLLSNQSLATVAFLGLYGAGSDWRGSEVGRHWLYWPAATLAVDLSWALLVLVHQTWPTFVLFGAQAIVGLLAWQRVWLVWKAQRV